MKHGIVVADQPTRKLFLEDGINFLESLKSYLDSGYLSASEIKESTINYSPEI